jgi:hypothetical protein
MTRSEMRARVDRDWQIVLPGVMATFTGRLDPEQRLVAGCLFAGPESMITSTTAARWRGLRTAVESPTIHVVVPANRYARSFRPVEVRRTIHPDLHPARRGALTIASPGRAVADAVRDASSQRQATAMVVEAVQRGLVSVPLLQRELEFGPRAGSTLLRRGLEVVRTAVWSVQESDLMTIVRSSACLPDVWANPVLTAPDGRRLPSPDLWIDEVALAIQVHSWLYHSDADDWESTIMNDGVYAEHGIAFLGLTPRRISDDPAWVLARLERTYESLLGRPRPPVRAERRSVGSI